MSQFIASWLQAAAEVLGAEFGSSVDLLPGAAIAAGASTFSVTVDLAGSYEGWFAATVEQGALESLLRATAAARAEAAGEPPPEAETAEAIQERWQALFRKTCIAAAAALGARSGAACEMAMISPGDPPPGGVKMGYQLLAAGTMTALLLIDEVAAAAVEAPPPQAPTSEAAVFPPPPPPSAPPPAGAEAGGWAAGKGLELLLDIELEASLRFGSREMVLSELLALGPGDVIQLDRALTDPVDLIVGDKIVARGEVVLVNGNFGLQVVEVAEPRKTLESIRCLF
jgi:flagellar motor switch protein FliN/FliY